MYVCVFVCVCAFECVCVFESVRSSAQESAGGLQETVQWCGTPEEHFWNSCENKKEIFGSGGARSIAGKSGQG